MNPYIAGKASMSAAASVSALRLADGPMDPTVGPPRYLDASQFAVFAIIGALVVFLLAIIAVGTFRR